jgi:uncharacterized MAPEG superfamily protein
LSGISHREFRQALPHLRQRCAYATSGAQRPWYQLKRAQGGSMDALLNNPALRLFGITYLILVVKMMAVGWYTSFHRISKGVFATPEDYRLQGVAPKAGANEDVERARRAHRNDLENILPFFGVGLLYALTNPSMTAASIFFIGFGMARVLHSVFYLAEMQPHRTIAFGVGQVLTMLMLLTTFVTLV